MSVFEIIFTTSAIEIIFVVFMFTVGIWLVAKLAEWIGLL